MSRDAEHILQIGLGNWGLRFLTALERFTGGQPVTAGSLDHIVALGLLERLCAAAAQSYRAYEDECQRCGFAPLDRATFEASTQKFFIALADEYGGELVSEPS